jgi:hypothetical protein
MRNDQLQALDVLLGDWDVTLSGAWFLDSLESSPSSKGQRRLRGSVTRSSS